MKFVVYEQVFSLLNVNSYFLAPEKFKYCTCVCMFFLQHTFCLYLA
jgi:hypothetical protein